ncbi:hypothetical protein A0H81_10325 [Grifola frondosa]|uniref:Uncharacterized protein n=1 Tax=Grifola frondosa TaxID=5627 RepID=A0A1C7M3Y9_GRIFR|nr:hypothetical protein A0H81_10325 [Grifola frondosa]
MRACVRVVSRTQMVGDEMFDGCGAVRVARIWLGITAAGVARPSIPSADENVRLERGKVPLLIFRTLPFGDGYSQVH